MVQRRDTDVTRHTGGWIVLGAGLLAVCLLGAWRGDAFSLPGNGLPRSQSLPASESQPAGSRDQNSFPQLCIDINLADEAELSCIPGIGPALARRIVEYRVHIGRFRTMAEVDNIPGVGPKLSAQMRSAMQPLPETEFDIAVAEPAHLVGRRIQLPFNEPLHD